VSTELDACAPQYGTPAAGVAAPKNKANTMSEAGESCMHASRPCIYGIPTPSANRTAGQLHRAT
jgi:hypothetical protein